MASKTTKTTPVKNVISDDTARALSSKMLTSISIQNGIHLADRKRPPSIGFFEDENQYFDNQAYAIHLGIFGPTKIFEVETEEDYVAGLQYFYGHENQHVRSTAHQPYVNGIKRATHEIIKYIAAREGIRKNFRNEKDYEVFVKTDLPSKDIYVSFQIIMNICADMANCIEDGRIERIRAKEFPGFEKERRYFRAIVWNQDHEFKPYADLTPADKLGVFINCILSLATTGLYPKGFVVAYGGTDLIDEVKQFMPYIAKGVLAQRTRDMADNLVEIAKLLSPYIYEVCKINKQQAQQLFEQMLAQMLAHLLSQMDPDKMAQTSEREEETDDGVPMPVFPMSDLTITLDDETYDKLMEKSKNSKSNGGPGIMVKREHPKDEDGEEGEGSNGSGDGKESDKESKNGKGQGKSAGDKQDGQDGSSGGGNQQSNEQGQEGQGSDGQGSDGQNGQSGDGSGDANKEGGKPYKKEYERGEGAASQNSKSNQGSHSAGGGRTGTAEMVEEQMKQAAKECREDVSDQVSNINQALEHSANNNRGNAKVVANADKPVTQAEVKEILGERGFEEKRREYTLDQQLPPLLGARAKAFRKKNEKYFRSLSTPNVSHLDSGSVDPSLIFNLAIGDTEIFRKIGMDKKFNGCVYVLLDNSGSMCGNKRTEASKAAAVIEEGFKGIIPMKIVAFDTCGPVIHEVIKGWDESQKLNCCWNFAKHGRNGCGNDDGYDILVAQKELLARPEEKKLLIVLSDGAPASVEDTKKAIQNTRKKGINVFGIYFEEGQIGSDAKEFQYMYEKDYVCCELAEVDNELTKLMIKFSRS